MRLASSLLLAALPTLLAVACGAPGRASSDPAGSGGAAGGGVDAAADVDASATDGGGDAVLDAGAEGGDAPDGNFDAAEAPADAADGDVSDMGVYAANNVFSQVPRVLLRKQDPARNLCFQIMLMSGDWAGPLAIDAPPGWHVQGATVTDHAVDCIQEPGWPPPPAGEWSDATQGSGLIEFAFPQGGTDPCLLSVHATLEFVGAPAWVPPSEPLDADGIDVLGGCQ